MVYTNPIALANDQVKWQGNYYEQNAKGNMFCFGGVSTALVAQNATATGLTATAKPIIGVYNPPNSGKNLSIIETLVLITNVAASAVSPGAFVYVTATGQAGNAATFSTGVAPISRFLGNATPSAALGYALTQALTGLSGSLTNTALPFNSTQIVASEPSTVAPMMGGQSAEDNQGSWIVPPGAFLGVMCTASTTTVSAASRMVWIELPVTGV